MMKGLYFLVFLPLPMMAACSMATSDGHSSTIYDKELRKAYQNTTQYLEEPREKIGFSSGGAATNCNEYNTLSAESTVAETVRDMLVKSEYLVCETLEILNPSNPVPLAFEGKSAGRALYENVDISELPLSIGRAVPSDSKTFSELSEDSVKLDDKSLEIHYGGAIISLELVAVSDINDNGIQDWIVWLSDEMQEGNYRAYQTLIILDVDSNDDLMKAEVVNFKD